MRLGIFGGSFDPVHYGHLLLAESCRQQCQLDEVRWVPVAVSPHKLDSEGTSWQHRIEMLKLALSGSAHDIISTQEIDRGGVSFTVDTLEELHRQRPQAELYFLMGADSLQDFPTWREPQRICELAIPTVVKRPGCKPLDFHGLRPFVSAERLEKIEQSQVEMPEMGLSSTSMRRQVSDGRSLRFQTPRAVEEYIRAQRLYR
jgi:nicotinate-nucleotide adenylyltransferase